LFNFFINSNDHFAEYMEVQEVRMEGQEKCVIYQSLWDLVSCIHWMKIESVMF